KIETKYNNGDRVWYATIGLDYEKQTCAECNGAGSLKIEGKSYTVACRDCNGRGHFSTQVTAPAARQLTLGQVRVEIAASPGDGEHSIFSNFGPVHHHKEEYMAVETGIGSGIIYAVERLFATEAEALSHAAILVHEARDRWATE